LAEHSGRMSGRPFDWSYGTPLASPSARAVQAYEVLARAVTSGGGGSGPRDEFSAILEPGAGSLVGLARWTMITEALRPSLARLESAGIQVWAWKGLDYAQTLYPSPRMRPMKDIDVLVHPGSLCAMTNILAATGWTRTDRPEHLVEAGIVGSATFTRGAVDLDVHHHPFYFPACMPGVLPGGLLTEGRPLAPGLLALSLGHSLLLHFLHMVQHACMREMWWLDAALLTGGMDAADWKLFAASAGPTGLAGVFALLLDRLSEVFSTAVPGAVTDSLHRAPDRSWILPLMRGRRGMPTVAALVALGGWRRISFAASLMARVAGGRTSPWRSNEGGG
jgi:hypothetical protein